MVSTINTTFKNSNGNFTTFTWDDDTNPGTGFLRIVSPIKIKKQILYQAEAASSALVRRKVTDVNPHLREIIGIL